MQDQEGKITNNLTPKDVEGTYQNMDNQENVDYRFTKADKPKSITELVKEIHAGNREKGFWDKFRNVGEMLMLANSELCEALEADRKGNYCKLSKEELKALSQNFDKDVFLANVKDSFEDELADTVIRVFDMAGGLGIDLESHLLAKLQYNTTREKLHGKKY